VASILVLWDVDYTLVDSDGVGRMLYEVAFREMFDADLPQPGLMAGRTDSAIALEVLTLAGLPEPRQLVGAFQAVLAAHAPELASAVREHARVLPGAVAVLAALASLPETANRGLSGRTPDGAAAGRGPSGGPTGAEPDGGPGPDGRPGPDGGPAAQRHRVVQALLTGNIRALAEVKLGPLGLLNHLDLDAGAYGDVHEVRAELVHVARRNAGRAYGRDFAGEATILVGDTPRDIEAALATGARAVGVATGSFTVAQLAAAGAHAVLPDLTDTSEVLAAILAEPAPPAQPEFS
jgi:phosphoglycolate phosphatase